MLGFGVRRQPRVQEVGAPEDILGGSRGRIRCMQGLVEQVKTGCMKEALHLFEHGLAGYCVGISTYHPKALEALNSSDILPPNQLVKSDGQLAGRRLLCR